MAESVKTQSLAQQIAAHRQIRPAGVFTAERVSTCVRVDLRGPDESAFGYLTADDARSYARLLLELAGEADA